MIWFLPGSVAEMSAPNLRQSSQVKKERCGKIWMNPNMIPPTTNVEMVVPTNAKV